MEQRLLTEAEAAEYICMSRQYLRQSRMQAVAKDELRPHHISAVGVGQCDTTSATWTHGSRTTVLS